MTEDYFERDYVQQALKKIKSVQNLDKSIEQAKEMEKEMRK